MNIETMIINGQGRRYTIAEARTLPWSTTDGPVDRDEVGFYENDTSNLPDGVRVVRRVEK